MWRRRNARIRIFLSGLLDFLEARTCYVGSLEKTCRGTMMSRFVLFFLCVCFHFPVRCSLSEWTNVAVGATVSLRSVRPTWGFQTVARAPHQALMSTVKIYEQILLKWQKWSIKFNSDTDGTYSALTFVRFYLKYLIWHGELTSEYVPECRRLSNQRKRKY